MTWGLLKDNNFNSLWSAIVSLCKVSSRTCSKAVVPFSLLAWMFWVKEEVPFMSYSYADGVPVIDSMASVLVVSNVMFEYNELS